MSLYIPNVKLPPDDKYKFNLVLHISYDGTVRSPWGYLITDGKAIEVPEHGDLIDRAKLPFNEVRLDEYGDWWMNVEDIETAPTIIPADGADKEKSK